MPARIGLDARMVGPVMTGLGRYALGLVTRVPALDPANHYIVIHRAHGGAALRAASGAAQAANVEHVIVEGDLDQPANLFAARAVNRLRLDLYHSLYDFVPPGLRARKIVLTLHDLTWLESADLCFDERLAWLKARVTNFYARLTMPYAARKASHVIAVSAHTRSRAIAILGLDPSRVAVVHHGVDPAAFPPASSADRAASPAGPFFLCLGNTKPYKNTRAAVAAFAQLASDYPSCRLVITGRTDSRRRLEALVRRVGIGARVEFTGAVSHERLLALMHGAEALVFPSIVEGFGLPLVEAMSAGCPVIGSTAEAVAEICGTAAILPDPRSPSAIAAAMRHLLEDRSAREELRARGFERARCFTWETCARATLAVYKSVLEVV